MNQKKAVAVQIPRYSLLNIIDRNGQMENINFGGILKSLFGVVALAVSALPLTWNDHHLFHI